jgi:succinoglycan biosynthesis protein ExoA
MISLPSPASTPSVLLVIPTLNEAENIAAVIATVAADFDFDGQSKIVVVDGGSTDRTRDIVRTLMATNPGIVLQHNPQRLQSAAVNLAVRKYGGDLDVLIRCDAHARYPRDFVSRLVAMLEQTNCDAVVVPMDSVGERCTGRAIGWLADSVVGSGGSAHRGGRGSGYVDHGHHAAFRLATFRIVGGYDESFGCNEDAELDARQRAIGATIYLDGSNRIVYHPRNSLAGLWRQYMGYGKGRSRTMRKHPGSIRLRQLAVPLNAVACVVSLLLGLWLPWLLLLPAAYLLALGVNGAVLARRHRSWCALGAVPAAVTMHYAWTAGLFSEILRSRERRWAPSMVEPLAP